MMNIFKSLTGATSPAPVDISDLDTAPAPTSPTFKTTPEVVAANARHIESLGRQLAAAAAADDPQLVTRMTLQIRDLATYAYRRTDEALRAEQALADAAAFAEDLGDEDDEDA